jgi:hypothetical protein
MPCSIHYIYIYIYIYDEAIVMISVLNLLTNFNPTFSKNSVSKFIPSCFSLSTCKKFHICWLETFIIAIFIFLPVYISWLKTCSKHIVAYMSDCRLGLDWRLDLLTTSTHHS